MSPTEQVVFRTDVKLTKALTLIAIWNEELPGRIVVSQLFMQRSTKPEDFAAPVYLTDVTSVILPSLFPDAEPDFLDYHLAEVRNRVLDALKRDVRNAHPVGSCPPVHVRGLRISP